MNIIIRYVVIELGFFLCQYPEIMTFYLNLVNSLPDDSKFFHLLIGFANSLHLDQARHNVGPDLDPCCLRL